jgi:RNA polymerase sigma-70 factor, ECF subfamily
MHSHPPAIVQVETPLTSVQLAHLSDEDVMTALCSGNGDALATLFDRYHRLVYSIAMKIVRDAGEAEDVMQNVFFEIFRAAAQFDPTKGTCKVWLLQYAYHRAISKRQHLNARKFYDRVNIDDAHPAVEKGKAGLGRFTQGELKHWMQQGLASLNAAQKQVIELATYQGLSMQEISVHTGETVVNVRHHYYRGLKKLRSFVDATADVQKGNAR